MLIAHESKVVCVVAVVVSVPSVRPPASPNDNAPLPFVFINCPFVPSLVGKVMELPVRPFVAVIVVAVKSPTSKSARA